MKQRVSSTLENFGTLVQTEEGEQIVDTARKEKSLDNVVGSSNPPQQIAVLGAGSWGTALAILLAANGHEVRLWSRSAALVCDLHEERENRAYLPGAKLPSSILPLLSLSEAVMGADAVVFAVPSGGVRETAAQVGAFLNKETLLLSAAKGLEEGTGLRMSQTLAQALRSAPECVVALSGPNLAVEVARGIPSASVAACADIEAARRAQRLFSRQATPTFRVYTSRDVVGVELGGAIKNVIAIGAGVCDGLGFGDNSKAALMNSRPDGSRPSGRDTGRECRDVSRPFGVGGSDGDWGQSPVTQLSRWLRAWAGARPGGHSE